VRELRDKVVVNTGGASGIGLALAGCLAAEGMKLALADIEPDPQEAALREAVLAHVLANAMPPEAIAAQVLAAIRDERFYILTHPESDEVVSRRMRAILEGRAPDVPAPPDLAGAASDDRAG
jgi:NAD(P)-dependent dehydrogenase (short-subunit alcohol dehydrogenase family)